MKNVNIEKEVHSGFTAWMVYADTERFGKHQIMAQCISKEEAERWCKANGVELEMPTAEERLEKEFWNGKIQIGNTMYRRIHIKDEKIMGYCSKWGWTDITYMIKECKMVSENIGKTKERITKTKTANRTVKFGNACSW